MKTGTLPVCVIAMTVAAFAAPADADRRGARIPLKAATMIIEYNDSAEDIGVQFFLDSDGWQEVEIFDPYGRQIFGAETEGSLTRQGGGTELFLESVEPPLDELPFETFFGNFPEGTYVFRGRDNDGNRLHGRAEFTHDIPAGPVLMAPVAVGDEECAQDVSLPVTIEWFPVNTSVFGEALAAVRYEVIVENASIHFDVKLPAETGTELTVSPELLQPGEEYDFEVLAIEASGNQTITEGCFATAE